MADFFTSDMHFGHANIIKFANRPFASLPIMNDLLIKRWNDVVKKADRVFILGDVALCPAREAIEYVKRLNGQLFLIEGNHDRKLVRNADFRSLFGWVEKLRTIRITDADAPGGSQPIVLCHYALRVWDKSHYGAWNLHGHSHGTLEPQGRQLDVGMDPSHYVPLPYRSVRAAIMREPIHTPDHHKESRADGS